MSEEQDHYDLEGIYSETYSDNRAQAADEEAARSLQPTQVRDVPRELEGLDLSVQFPSPLIRELYKDMKTASSPNSGHLPSHLGRRTVREHRRTESMPGLGISMSEKSRALRDNSQNSDLATDVFVSRANPPDPEIYPANSVQAHESNDGGILVDDRSGYSQWGGDQSPARSNFNTRAVPPSYSARSRDPYDETVSAQHRASPENRYYGNVEIPSYMQPGLPLRRNHQPELYSSHEAVSPQPSPVYYTGTPFNHHNMPPFSSESAYLAVSDQNNVPDGPLPDSTSPPDSTGDKGVKSEKDVSTPKRKRTRQNYDESDSPRRKHNRSQSSPVDRPGHRRAPSARAGIRAGKYRRESSSKATERMHKAAASVGVPTYIPGLLRGGVPDPVLQQRPPGGYYWGVASDEATKHFPTNPAGTIPIQLCEPPLMNVVPPNPAALAADPQPRTRKKSKYTAEQDRLILELKHEGLSWSEIARLSNCDKTLSARNRYQVLIGQQGGGGYFWGESEARVLQRVLDEGEKAKWAFISEELSLKRGRRFTMEMCHYKISEMFAENPEQFGIRRSTNPEVGGRPMERQIYQDDITIPKIAQSSVIPALQHSPVHALATVIQNRAPIIETVEPDQD